MFCQIYLLHPFQIDSPYWNAVLPTAAFFFDRLHWLWIDVVPCRYWLYIVCTLKGTQILFIKTFLKNQNRLTDLLITFGLDSCILELFERLKKNKIIPRKHFLVKPCSHVTFAFAFCDKIQELVLWQQVVFKKGRQRSKEKANKCDRTFPREIGNNASARNWTAFNNSIQDLIENCYLTWVAKTVQISTQITWISAFKFITDTKVHEAMICRETHGSLKPDKCQNDLITCLPYWFVSWCIHPRFWYEPSKVSDCMNHSQTIVTMKRSSCYNVRLLVSPLPLFLVFQKLSIFLKLHCIAKFSHITVLFHFICFILQSYACSQMESENIWTFSLVYKSYIYISKSAIHIDVSTRVHHELFSKDNCILLKVLISTEMTLSRSILISIAHERTDTCGSHSRGKV